jgi:antitoxin HicB
MKNFKQTKHHFTAIFERNELGGYTVTVPALPGLITEGKDLNDSRKMAEDAIRCYIEGLRKAKEKVPKEQELAQMQLSVRG